MITSFRLWVALIFFVLCHSKADGRPLPPHDVQTLTEGADVIVVVTAQGPAMARKDAPVLVDGLPVAETLLLVRAVLKGDVKEKEIKVLHLQASKEALNVINGPCLIRFQHQGNLIGKGSDLRTAPPEYLIFLKSREGGGYEPVTGIFDAALSVRRLTREEPVIWGEPDANEQ